MKDMTIRNAYVNHLFNNGICLLLSVVGDKKLTHERCFFCSVHNINIYIIIDVLYYYL